ncbi:hypothetical protein JCM14036_22940 [Desulfotomaculum defluvii]
MVRAVEEYRALDTEQIRVLFFNSMTYGRRKAQERLLKLYQRKRLQREKVDGIYTYYPDRPPGLIKHLLALNWVRIWLAMTCKSWERLESFTYEQDYGILRTDGFVAIKNTVTCKHRFMFIELDRSCNTFDKVEKYNQLFESGYYGRWWWVKLTDCFPAILVVTTSPTRAVHINQLIKERNNADLNFKVFLLDGIKKEVMDLCK